MSVTLACGVVAAVLARGLADAARRDAVRRRTRALRTPRRDLLPTTLRTPLTRALDAAGLDVRPVDAIAIVCSLVALVALLTWSLAPVLVPVTAVGTLGAVLLALRMRARAREARLVAALPDLVEMIAADLRAGGTLRSAVTVGASSPDPIGPALTRVAARGELGLSMRASLDAWRREHRDPAIALVAGALALIDALGGAAAGALEGLAASLRARAEVVAEAHALSTQARLSAYVVGLAPLAYLVVSAALDGDALQVLIATSGGRLCLTLGVALEVVALVWIRRLVRIT